MKRIDFENHFYHISAIEALAARSEYPKYCPDTNIISWEKDIDMPQNVLLPQLLEMGEKRIKMMDELRIDAAVIGCSPGIEQLDEKTSIDVCRKTNDALYWLTREYPGRYIGSAILPVKNVEAARAELERCKNELGFVAWHTHSNYGSSYPDEDRYRPLFKKAAELGMYVYLHPQLPSIDRLLDLGFTFGGPGLGFTIDTCITIMKMIAKGLLDDIPNLRIVLGHLGEALPFLLERIDNRMNFLPNPKLKNKRPPSYYFKNNIMVTTSGNMSPEAFECTKKVLGIENIMFGSDHPFENAADMVDFVEKLTLSASEREALYWKNAKKLNIVLA